MQLLEIIFDYHMNDDEINELDLSDRGLTALPPLPNTLKELSCNDNSFNCSAPTTKHIRIINM